MSSYRTIRGLSAAFKILGAFYLLVGISLLLLYPRKSFLFFVFDIEPSGHITDIGIWIVFFVFILPLIGLTISAGMMMILKRKFEGGCILLINIIMALLLFALLVSMSIKASYNAAFIRQWATPALYHKTAHLQFLKIKKILAPPFFIILASPIVVLIKLNEITGRENESGTDLQRQE